MIKWKLLIILCSLIAFGYIGCEPEHPCHVVIGDKTGTIIWTDCPDEIIERND